MRALFVFLYKNKKWMKVDQQKLYNFAVWVAQSPAKLKDQVMVRNREVHKRIPSY